MTLRWRSNWPTRPFEGPSSDTLDGGSVDMANRGCDRGAALHWPLTHVLISDLTRLSFLNASLVQLLQLITTFYKEPK